MNRILRALVAALVLLAGTAIAAAAQDSASGTINTLTVNPRQNAELTNSTGTETGQPSDAVPGSESQPNGLVPVTTKMEGSGSNGNMTQTTPGNKPATPSTSVQTPPQQQSSTKPAQQESTAKPQK